MSDPERPKLTELPPRYTRKMHELLPGLTGKLRAHYGVGMEAWWAHDAGLLHDWSVLEGPDDARFVVHKAELILWHDVRDVEVTTESRHLHMASGDRGISEVRLLVQYPRIDLTRPRDDRLFMRFCVEVVRLASEAHR